MTLQVLLPAMVPAGAFTAAAMFVALYYALLKGKLYTRRSHDEIVTIKDQQIADGKAQVVLWRAVGETSQAQLSEMLEHSRMSVQLLTAIDARSRGEGGPS